MAALGITDFLNYVATKFASVKPGKIRAGDARDVMSGVAESFHNKVDDIVSGSYTATVTGVTGVASVSGSNLWYTKVGNVVTVYGSVALTSNTDSNVAFRISLPVAKNISAATEVSGVVISQQLIFASGFIDGNESENEAEVHGIGINGSEIYTVHFSYKL